MRFVIHWWRFDWPFSSS